MVASDSGRREPTGSLYYLTKSGLGQKSPLFKSDLDYSSVEAGSRQLPYPPYITGRLAPLLLQYIWLDFRC